MESKIINRVRDQQEKARAFRFWQGMQALADAEKAKQRIQRQPSIDLSQYAGTYGGYQQNQPPKRHWWQFWR